SLTGCVILSGSRSRWTPSNRPADARGGHVKPRIMARESLLLTPLLLGWLPGGWGLTGSCVLDHVLADPEGEADGRAGGGAFALVPVGGQILPGVDDRGPARHVDSHQRVTVRSKVVPRRPDGMAGRKGSEFAFPLGEDLLHQLLEPRIEPGGAAASVGQNEPA